MKEYRFVASSEDAGVRLDILLSNFCKEKKLGVSRTLVKALILKGAVSAKGAAVLTPHYRVKPQDEVRFSIEEKAPLEIKAEQIKFDIVYDDSDLAVINKPSGLVVHPAPGNYEHTLVNALKNVFSELSDINPARPGIVHRLDKETSGLLIIAKNNFSHLALTRQFTEHTIKKEYIAIVKGIMEFDEGVVEAPISRHLYKRKNMAVSFSQKAKEAKTYYRTLKRFKDFSLIELRPFTGRTHQLRVHLDFIGHPVLGDEKYGKNNKFSRLALHARRLIFTHPKTGKVIDLTAPVPEEILAYTK
jgi:23S rRNA pseudouridine1911/1915/1917 synthase